MSLLANVDLRQVRALTTSALNSEWRISNVIRRSGNSKVRWMAIFSLLGYPIIGLMLAGILRKNPSGEPFIAACALISLYLMIVTITNIFTSFGSGFLSPDEVQILSPFPISSETFFVSRVAVLVIYSVAIASGVALAPSIFAGIYTHFNVRVMLGMFGMTILTTLTTALSVVTFYGLLLLAIPHKRLSKMFSYVQFLGTFVTAFAYVLLPRLIDHAHLDPYTLAARPDFIWLPPFWFAAFGAKLMDLGLRPESTTLSIVTLGILVFMAFSAFGLLAKRYTFQVQEFRDSASRDARQYQNREREARAAGRDTSILRRVLFRTPEGRAVWTLFQAQFRNDPKFRLATFSTLPITALYFVMALLDDGIRDPFTVNPLHVLQANLLYISTLVSPILMLQQISQSHSFKASWIFFSTPVDRAQLTLSARNIVLSLVLVPYMVIIATAFSFYMPVHHALMHVLTLAGIAVIIAETYLLIAPRMPFSEQRREQQNSFMAIFWMMVLAILPLGGLFLIMYFCYHDPIKYVAAIAGLFTIAALVDQLVRGRLRKRLEALEYAG